MHLVGSIVRNYHDARSHDRQILISLLLSCADYLKILGALTS